MSVFAVIAGFLLAACSPLVVSIDDEPAKLRLCETAEFPQPELGGTRLSPCERGKAAVVGFKGFDSVQQAIVDAKDGRTVHVCPGVHDVSLRVVGRQLVLAGVPSVIGPAVLKASRGRVLDLVESNVVLTDLAVAGGQAAEGGGIRAVSSELRLQSVMLRANQADELGGGIYAEDSVLQLVDVTFLDNHTLGSGGAVAQRDGCADVERTEVIRNSAQRHGGGWFYAGQPPSDVAMSIDLTHFLANVAGGRGGALALGGVAGRAELLIRQSQIVGNRAGSDGGAIATDGTGELRVDLSQGLLDANEAGDRGGAIATVGGLEHALEISNSTFTRNVAATHGGAVSHHARGRTDSITLRGVDMADNHALAGLGVVVTGTPGTLALTDVQIEGVPFPNTPGYLVMQPAGDLTARSVTLTSIGGGAQVLSACGDFEVSEGEDFSCRDGRWSLK